VHESASCVVSVSCDKTVRRPEVWAGRRILFPEGNNLELRNSGKTSQWLPEFLSSKFEPHRFQNPALLHQQRFR
jgi:hypothetical protein